MGIWYETLLRWVGEAKKVTAMSKTFVKMRKDEKGKEKAIKIPDHINIIVDMVCGAQVFLIFQRFQDFLVNQVFLYLAVKQL